MVRARGLLSNGLWASKVFGCGPVTGEGVLAKGDGEGELHIATEALAAVDIQYEWLRRRRDVTIDLNTAQNCGKLISKKFRTLE